MTQETEINEQLIEAIGKTTAVDDLVGYYVDFRDQKEALKRELTERQAPIDAYMERIETRLMEVLNDSGQESAKTKFGTAYKTPFISAKVADRKVFLEYVKKNDAFDLLTDAVSKTAVRDRIAETGKPVPGVDIVTIQKIGVRRAQ